MRRANLEPKVSTQRDHPASNWHFDLHGNMVPPNPRFFGKKIGAEDNREPHPKYQSEKGPAYNSHFGFDLTHGYVFTSPASQSASKHHSISDQPTNTFGAVSMPQELVTVSRAAITVTVYTDSIDGLGKAIQRDESREGVHDILDKEGWREAAKPSQARAREAMAQEQARAKGPSAKPSPEQGRPQESSPHQTPAQPDQSYDTYHSYTQNQPEPSQDRGQERSID
jgi:hypothetical protein